MIYYDTIWYGLIVCDLTLYEVTTQIRKKQFNTMRHPTKWCNSLVYLRHLQCSKQQMYTDVHLDMMLTIFAKMIWRDCVTLCASLCWGYAMSHPFLPRTKPSQPSRRMAVSWLGARLGNLDRWYRDAQIVWIYYPQLVCGALPLRFALCQLSLNNFNN